MADKLLVCHQKNQKTHSRQMWKFQRKKNVTCQESLETLRKELKYSGKEFQLKYAVTSSYLFFPLDHFPVNL